MKRYIWVVEVLRKKKPGDTSPKWEVLANAYHTRKSARADAKYYEEIAGWRAKVRKYGPIRERWYE